MGRKDPVDARQHTMRFGVAYNVGFVNNWFMEPYIGVDVIEHEDNEAVLGIYFGKQF